MTKAELITEMKQRGFAEPEYFAGLTDPDYCRYVTMLRTAPLKKAWEQIEKEHDEIIYFKLFAPIVTI